MHKLLLNFEDEKLLRQALTHRSYVNENPGEIHNERLERQSSRIILNEKSTFARSPSKDLKLK
jgi:hypothetical protein